MSLQLYSAASGVLRDAHYVKNPVTGLYERTTLIEPAYTNLVTSDNFDSGWTSVGSPVITSGISDPAGGTGAYRIADDDGAVSEGKRFTVSFTGDGTKPLVVVVREAAMPASGNQEIWLHDSTAGTSRARLGISAWSSGEPTVAVSGGFGTYLGKAFLGNGYWALYFLAPGVVAANTNVFDIYPAIAAAQTGSIDIYRANAFNATVPPAAPLSASGVKNADVAYLDFTAAPQEMTVYARFFELGGSDVDSSRVFQISSAAAANPRLAIYALSGLYRGMYHNGTTEVYSPMAASPSYGQLVELRLTLSGAGVVQLHQSLNGASETSATASAANALPSAWSDTRLYVGSAGSTGQGVNAFSHVYAWAGTKTLAECRALAGVS